MVIWFEWKVEDIPDHDVMQSLRPLSFPDERRPHQTENKKTELRTGTGTALPDQRRDIGQSVSCSCCFVVSLVRSIGDLRVIVKANFNNPSTLHVPQTSWGELDPYWKNSPRFPEIYIVGVKKVVLKFYDWCCCVLTDDGERQLARKVSRNKNEKEKNGCNTANGNANTTYLSVLREVVLAVDGSTSNRPWSFIH